MDAPACPRTGQSTQDQENFNPTSKASGKRVLVLFEGLEISLPNIAGDDGRFIILLEVAGKPDGAFDLGLGWALSGASIDVTVFAPTDLAFIALAPLLGFPADEETTVDHVKAFYAPFDGANLETLRDVAFYHAVGGKSLARCVDGLDSVKALLGEEIDLSRFPLLTGNTILVDADPDACICRQPRPADAATLYRRAGIEWSDPRGR